MTVFSWSFVFVWCLFAHRDLGRLGGRAVHDGRAADSPSPFGVLAAHKMSRPGATSLDLAGSGDLDSLCHPLVGLLFRHLQYSRFVFPVPARVTCAIGSSLTAAGYGFARGNLLPARV